MTLIPQTPTKPVAKPAAIDDDLDEEVNGHAKTKTKAVKAKPAAKAATKTKETHKAKPAAKTKATPKNKGKPDLGELETTLIKKYPEQKIIKGSLRDVGTIQGHGNKRTIEINCSNAKCTKKRRIATSDLHQTRYCPDCTKEVRQSRRGTTKPKKVAAKKKATAKA